MKYTINAIILYIFIIFSSDLLALDPYKKIHQYYHRIYDIEHGLPQMTVLEIAQTNDNYIWIGTQEGLARFDGVKFKVFDKASHAKIKHNWLSTLFVDSNSTLWFATGNDDLLQMKDGKLYSTPQIKNLNKLIRTILVEKDGGIWLGTSEGLYYLKDKLKKVEELQDRYIFDIFKDHSGKMYIPTNRDLNIFDGDNFHQVTTPFKVDRFSSVIEDQSGNILVGTSSGLFILKDKKLERIYEKEIDDVTTILSDKDKNLWIGTNSGILKIFGENIDLYNKEKGLSNNHVKSIFEDLEGNIWVGTAIGVNLFSECKLKTFGIFDGLKSAYIFSIHQKNDDIFVGNGVGFIYRYKDHLFQEFKLPKPMKNVSVTSLLIDSKNRLLFSIRRKGLYIFENGSLIHYNKENGLNDNYVRTIFEDSKGILWVATDKGINTLSVNSKDMKLQYHKNLSKLSVSTFLEDKEGNIFIGTRSGLYKYDTEKNLTRYSKENGLSSNKVYLLYGDNEGIWIGTIGGGLNLFKDNKFSSITQKDGLADDTQWSINEDSLGYFWFSSNKGVWRVRKQNILDFFEKKVDRVHSESFDIADGIVVKECNGGFPAAIKRENGELWFACMGGVVTVNPKKIPTNKNIPNVMIESFVVNGKKMNLKSNLDLPKDSNKFEFNYTATSFTNPKRVYFKYQLEGFDSEWIDAKTKRSAYYTNLEPGEYTFKVKACNNDGIWNNNGTSISFYRAPKFYETVWIYFVFLISFSGLFYLIYKIKTNNLRRFNERLSRFVPDEFLLFLHKKHIVDIELGDQTYKKMTILFSDIRSFATLSEGMSPQQNFNFINSYLKRVGPAIRDNNGFIDKYMGDSIMALFAQCPDDAVKAAIQTHNKLKTYNDHRKKSGYSPVKIGTGIHSGDVMLGTIGEEQRIEGTVISDAVNVASRMEGLTKHYSIDIAISQEVFFGLENPEIYSYRFLGKVKVKGKNDYVSVFEIFDHAKDSIKSLKLQTKDLFELGIIKFYQKDLEKSLKNFNAVLEINPGDKSAQFYKNQVLKLMKTGIPEDWEPGMMTEK